jgi:hypothetical protein
MTKPQIFKYILPISILLFYSITITRMAVWGWGDGTSWNFPVFGFPFVFHIENGYLENPTGILPMLLDLIFYFICTFVLFFIAKKFIRLKEYAGIPYLLWVICGSRLTITVFFFILQGHMDWRFSHEEISPGSWGVEFFSLKF